jgi:hypothetical protein
MNDRTARSPLRAGTALAVAALLILLCAPAQAGRTGQRPSRPRPAATGQATAVTPPAAPISTPPVGAAGMIIAIDPESGAFVLPTAAQVLRLTSAEQTGLSRSFEGLTQVRLVNGAVMVDLQGRFLEYSVLRLDLQGRPRAVCVDDEHALVHWLTSCEPAPTPVIEEK